VQLLIRNVKVPVVPDETPPEHVVPYLHPNLNDTVPTISLRILYEGVTPPPPSNSAAV